MNIKPSAAIRKNYNAISNLCKQTHEPVYLTKNGEGDLVVMDMETYIQRESMLKLREILLSSEEEMQSGCPGFTVGEVTAAMREAVKEVVHAKRD